MKQEDYNKLIAKIFDKAKKNGMQSEVICTDSFYEIIFNHDFAKAFFGDEDLNGHCGQKASDFEDTNESCCYYGCKGMEWFIPAWKYHLQKMVVCNEPISYLQKYL